MLLFTADKPLEESSLHWILSRAVRQEVLAAPGSTGRLFWVAVAFTLCLSNRKMMQHVKRRQKQQTETNIDTSVSSYAHAARWTLLSAAAGSAESAQPLTLNGPSGNKTTDCGAASTLDELRRTSVCVSLLSVATSKTFSTVCPAVTHQHRGDRRGKVGKKIKCIYYI